MNSTKFRELLRKRLFIIFLIIIQILFLCYSMVNTSKLSSVVTILMLVVSVLVTLYIVAEKGQSAYKLTWVIIILTFPLFGGLFYLIFHLQTSKRRIESIDKFKDNPFNLNSLNIDDNDYIPQITYLEKYAGFPIYSNTETTYIYSGEEMFVKMCDELKKAKKYIFLEYYIISEGKMWNTILDILKYKIREGVLVRVIYDDMGCFLKLSEDYISVLEGFGIECVVFNPFTPVISTLQNNRDHRKITVIDGKTAFTGGINLSDEYINESKDTQEHWKDAGIMLKGNGVWSMALMFLEMWRYCTNTDEPHNGFLPEFIDGEISSCNGYVQPFTDSPMDKENVAEHIYLKIINSAKKYLYISTPYLIVDDNIISCLCLAQKSGVDVRILTPSVADSKIVHMTTRSYYRELIDAGVKIYEYSKGFVHSKLFVCDDTIATVGTANFDFRSLYLNFECGVVLYDTESICDIKEDFEKTFECCRLIEEKDLKIGFVSGIIQDILRIFAPLM